jgi:P27 family predicted phage terminase small subunit
MGQRGPKTLPANVHMLRGNPSKKSIADLLGEFSPEVETPDCPKHLWPAARKEWKRISIELETYGLISRLDRAALALYCQAWARWVWAEEMLSRKMKAAAEQEAKAIAEGKEWTGGDGFMIPTVNGNFAYSPYWVAARQAGDQVDKFLASFGMSPSARSRVSVSDNRQLPLPLDGSGKSSWEAI